MAEEKKQQEGSSFSIAGLQKEAEDKVAAAGKAVQDQVAAAVGTAEAALDAGVSAVSAAVRSGVAGVGDEVAAARSRAQQFYDTGVAHYEAAEAQALALLRRGVRCVTVDHPDASLAAGVAAAAILLPGPRRFLFRHTLGRFRSEEAMYRSAELRYGQLKERAEAQAGELRKLTEELAAAEAEYARSLSKLKSAASALGGLGSRAHSSSKAASGLVRDLRELPSKQALQLRSDAATTAAALAGQQGAVAKMARRLAKQYGI